jgi:hypothetical protein
VIECGGVGSAKLAWWGVGGVRISQFDTIRSMCHVIIYVSVE